MANDLMNLDFASLRTLQQVYSHGSVSRAAESMGLAQSTVSYTISRLREAFNDPLLVRQGQGIVPTPRCAEIVAQASSLLDRFEALAAPREFDPKAASLEIGLSCNYYERVTIIPDVARALRRKAPGIRLKIIPSMVRGKRQLTQSESDILIGPIQIAEAGYYKRSLFTEEYVCIMDPENPLACNPLTINDYVAAPQVIVNYGGNFRSRFLTVMEQSGHSPNTVMEVPSPANLHGILRHTDMIATVPTRIARDFGDTVVVVPCPFSAEVPIDMFWTARTHASAPHIWLRSVIATVAMRSATESRPGPLPQ